MAVSTIAATYARGAFDRRAAIRKSQQRQRERLLCRGNSGRNPDAFIKDRRSEGDLAHFHTALSKRTEKLARDRRATWRCPHFGRKCAEERRHRPGERA